MAKENSVIDWEAYGVLLKAARLANGYTRGRALAEAVAEQTGMAVSERTIYALEDASRAPSADIFLALQQVLPELRDPEYLKPVFKNESIKVVIVEL
ncbi:helix-turn-helix domain-containing protein [uncultured Adlercreutzia sp.]|uniref:helix-turn-helix domain-containing protein n=1 Tax=uncultured Adlercreutzia sp. TaxID=875803 RepID=UPI00267584D6|nr:helix-turn-helix domain-containing protein [uncultured Adlercreutzia sp.]